MSILLSLQDIKSKLPNLSKNNEIIINNIIGAVIIKGLALIISLLTMPAYIRYFGNQEVLGLWFTILSILNWILTFDLGIGNGLRNNLVVFMVNKKQDDIRKCISSAYIATGFIVLLIIFISFFIFPFIDWNTLMNIDSNIIPKEILKKTVFIVFSGIMLQFILKLVTSILYAMQKSAIINALSLINSIVILIYVLLAPPSRIENNLISLAIVNVLAVNIPLLSATIFVFRTKLRGCYPKIRWFNFDMAQNVMKLGGIFFWVQIMYMILSTTNEFLISWLSGPNMVVEYQIYNKLFTLIGMFFTVGLTPIWSAITKGVAERNYVWIKKLVRFLYILVVFAIVFEFALIPFLQLGVNIWLGNQAISVNLVYAFIFAINGSIFLWNGVISSITNGFGCLKVQTICFTIGVIIKIPLAIVLVNVLNSWIGVIIANIIAMMCYCIAEPIYIKKIISEIGRK